MRGILFFIFIGSLLTPAFAQKTKSIDVVKVSMASLHVGGIISYNENNTPLDTTYYLMGRDGRYQQLIEFVTVFNGDIEAMYKFLKYSLNFYNTEEDGVTETKDGHTLSIYKLMGQKFVYIYELKGNGYIGFNKSMFNNLIGKIEKWAAVNKISLK